MPIHKSIKKTLRKRFKTLKLNSLSLHNHKSAKKIKHNIKNSKKHKHKVNNVRLNNNYISKHNKNINKILYGGGDTIVLKHIVNKFVIYASGSFAPIHEGHVAMIDATILDLQTKYPSCSIRVFIIPVSQHYKKASIQMIHWDERIKLCTNVCNEMLNSPIHTDATKLNHLSIEVSDHEHITAEENNKTQQSTYINVKKFIDKKIINDDEQLVLLFGQDNIEGLCGNNDSVIGVEPDKTIIDVYGTRYENKDNNSNKKIIKCNSWDNSLNLIALKYPIYMVLRNDKINITDDIINTLLDTLRASLLKNIEMYKFAKANNFIDSNTKENLLYKTLEIDDISNETIIYLTNLCYNNDKFKQIIKPLQIDKGLFSATKIRDIIKNLNIKARLEDKGLHKKLLDLGVSKINIEPIINSDLYYVNEHNPKIINN